MSENNFFRGCRAEEHQNKSTDASSIISASAFYPDERKLSPNNTYDISICWQDDDGALSFFYHNDKKKYEGKNTQSGISELDCDLAKRNLQDLGLQDLISFNHEKDPGDPDNTYHGNICFRQDYLNLLQEKYPKMGKKARRRQICEQIAMAEKCFYTPHDLQCMFPEE